MATVTVIGRCLMGVKRVWGEGATFEEAYQECLKAAEEYCKRRPDCWPLTLTEAKNEDRRSNL